MNRIFSVEQQYLVVFRWLFLFSSIEATLIDELLEVFDPGRWTVWFIRLGPG